MNIAITCTVTLKADPTLALTAGVLRYRDVHAVTITMSGKTLDAAHVYRLTLKRRDRPSGAALSTVTSWTVAAGGASCSGSVNLNVADIATLLGDAPWIQVDANFRDDTADETLGAGVVKLWNSTARADDTPPATAEDNTYTDDQIEALLDYAGVQSETYTASEEIGGHRIVSVNASGEIELTDLSDAASVQAAVGMTTGAVAQGATATVRTAGYLTESSWTWTPGLAVYAGASGVPTQTPPSGHQLIIGVAKSATRVLLRLEKPIFTV